MSRLAYDDGGELVLSAPVVQSWDDPHAFRPEYAEQYEMPVPEQVKALRWWKGQPVQWVLCWSDEFPHGVKWDPECGAWVLTHLGETRSGEPMVSLAGCHVDRGRHSKFAGVCRVCGLPITGSPWYALFTPMDRWTEPLFLEPPSCYSCFRFSLEACPGMVRRLVNLGAPLFQVHSAVLIEKPRRYNQHPKFAAGKPGGPADLDAETLKVGGVTAIPWTVMQTYNMWTPAEVLASETEPFKAPERAYPDTVTAEEVVADLPRLVTYTSDGREAPHPLHPDVDPGSRYLVWLPGSYGLPVPVTPAH